MPCFFFFVRERDVEDAVPYISYPALIEPVGAGVPDRP